MAHKSKAAEERTTTGDLTPVDAGVAGGEALQHQIQLRAYYRYCERGCAPGADVNDWLAAEQEVLFAHADQDPSAVRTSAT